MYTCRTAASVRGHPPQAGPLPAPRGSGAPACRACAPGGRAPSTRGSVEARARPCLKAGLAPLPGLRATLRPQTRVSTCWWSPPQTRTTASTASPPRAVHWVKPEARMPADSEQPLCGCLRRTAHTQKHPGGQEANRLTSRSPGTRPWTGKVTGERRLLGTRPLVERVRSDGKTVTTPRRPQETQLGPAGLRRGAEYGEMAPRAGGPVCLGTWTTRLCALPGGGGAGPGGTVQPEPRTHDRGLATGGNQGHSPPWCPERRAHRPLCRALKDTAASRNTGEKTLHVTVSSGNHVYGQ